MKANKRIQFSRFTRNHSYSTVNLSYWIAFGSKYAVKIWIKILKIFEVYVRTVKSFSSSGLRCTTPVDFCQTSQLS